MSLSVSADNAPPPPQDEPVITISENLKAVLDDDGSLINAHGPYSTHVFTFDHVYDQNATQKKVSGSKSVFRPAAIRSEGPYWPDRSMRPRPERWWTRPCRATTPPSSPTAR
jgi:hypothetical protein